MKKKSIKYFVNFLCLLLILSMIPSIGLISYAAEGNEKDDINFFTTSSGENFQLTDFNIYIEDFSDVEFTESQEVIDYIYEVGTQRKRTRDVQYTIFGKSLTEDELSLIIAHPLSATIAYNCSEDAVSTTSYYYPNSCGDGELGNAFQHAYWVMLMYYNISPSFAINFAIAHENYDDNPTIHKDMDLFNDNVAYNYCNNLDSSVNYSDAVLAVHALQMMEDGMLEYIIFNYEYISLSVYYKASHKTINYTSTLDLYAYTNSTTPYNIPETEYRVITANIDIPTPIP